MKQFQFEVKNLNNLIKELARVKRFVKNENYSSIFFQLFTTLEDFDEVSKITDIIDQEFPDGYYYGCQTFGNIFEGKLSTQSTMIVCSVFEFETTKAKVTYIDPTAPDCECQSLQDLWDFCNENKWVKGVELISSYKGSEMLGVGRAIENLREDVHVYGGLAINPHDMGIADTYIWAKGHKPSALAAIAVAIGGPDLFVDTGHIRGWEALGKTFTITSCEGKRIRKIDNEPAMNIYRKYLNIEQDENFLINGMTFPLLVNFDGIECIRMPFPCENSDEIDLIGNVEKGMSVRLSYGEKSTILQHAIDNVSIISKFAPDTIRIYSCAARRAFWGDDEVGKETSVFDDIASTVGFYTRGEILRIGNYLHYFNSTMVVSLIREGEIYDYGFDVSALHENVATPTGLAPRLIDYISAVTGELQGQYNSTMRGMASIYQTMFLIDMEEKTLTQLDTDKVATRYLAEKEDYFDKMKNFLRYVVVDSMLYQAMMFCDYHTLKARLRYKNVIDTELVSRAFGWFRAQFVVVNRNSGGIPTHFVFTTQIIDDEKKAVEEQQRIIQALADTYLTLYEFDFEKDSVLEVSSQELTHRIHTQNVSEGCQETINAIIAKTAASDFVETMKKFTDWSSLDERMGRRKAISIEFYGVKGWVKAMIADVERYDDGKLKKVIFATQDIDEEKRKEEKLVKHAMTDSLTGLYNRRAYEMDIKDASQQENRELDFTIAVIDVNGLKAVNDSLGHEAGDEIIIGAAECIKRCLAPYGKAYRIGGDEFCAIMYVDSQKLAKIKEDLTRNVSEWSGKLVGGLSMSCGYVSSHDYREIPTYELIKIADRNMYAAKEEYYKSKRK